MTSTTETLRLQRLAEQRRIDERETLRSLLSEEQWQSYLETGKFELIAPSGRVYELQNGYVGNVQSMAKYGNSYVMMKYCCHPAMVSDAPWTGGAALYYHSYEYSISAQVVALLSDEQGFLARANLWSA